MDRGAWWAAVRGVAEGRTRLSNFAFTFHFHALEKEMATHSSVLAWRIPGMGEPGGLPSMGSHRVGHNWSDLAVAVFCILHPLGLFILLYNCKFVPLNSHHLFHPPTPGNSWFILCICESVFVLYVEFILRFCTYVRPYGIYISLSSLFHVA